VSAFQQKPRHDWGVAGHSGLEWWYEVPLEYQTFRSERTGVKKSDDFLEVHKMITAAEVWDRVTLETREGQAPSRDF
jgi:hypothetical protein